jgi:hypothetical protein
VRFLAEYPLFIYLSSMAKSKNTPLTEPAPSVPPEAPEAPEASEPAYTLKDLHERAGPATDEEVMSHIEGHSPTELVDMGADVATSRINTDCARDYGQAFDFWLTASEDQKDAMPGMSDDLLRIAIYAARRGQLLEEQLERGSDQGEALQDRRRAVASAVRQDAKARRNQLRSSLAVVVAGDAGLVLELRAAYGTASDATHLANSLKNLAALGRRLLVSTDPKIIARRSRTRLTTEHLTKAEAMAEDMKTTGAAAESTRPIAPVTQGTVDLWDGINLTLYEQIVDIFAAGRESDPTIPRLGPKALRRFFRQARKTGPKSPGGTDTPPSGGAPSGGTTPKKTL